MHQQDKREKKIECWVLNLVACESRFEVEESQLSCAYHILGTDAHLLKGAR